jgi:hypothetical protein
MYAKYIININARTIMISFFIILLLQIISDKISGVSLKECYIIIDNIYITF